MFTYKDLCVCLCACGVRVWCARVRVNSRKGRGYEGTEDIGPCVGLCVCCVRVRMRMCVDSRRSPGN